MQCELTAGCPLSPFPSLPSPSRALPPLLPRLLPSLPCPPSFLTSPVPFRVPLPSLLPVPACLPAPDFFFFCVRSNQLISPEDWRHLGNDDVTFLSSCLREYTGCECPMDGGGQGRQRKQVTEMGILEGSHLPFVLKTMCFFLHALVHGSTLLWG